MSDPTLIAELDEARERLAEADAVLRDVRAALVRALATDAVEDTARRDLRDTFARLPAPH